MTPPPDRDAVDALIAGAIFNGTSALAALEAAGLRVVPVEATTNMNGAHLLSVGAHGKRESHLHWQAMLAASPYAPPQQEDAR